MLHAYRNPGRVIRLDDLVMLTGADRTGRLVEVGVASAEGVELIVHAMHTREVPEVRRMPRSIQEILDHADELARRFEEYEPDPGDEEPVAEYLLRRAALERARSERHIVEAVVAAREEGLSWARIGELLGTSAQAAQQRYGAVAGGVTSL